MPNHIHGIINILSGPDIETPLRGVSTTTPTTGNQSWKPNSLGSIINQYKSICTKRIRGHGYENFGWQPRFYDNIVRDENSLQKIRFYIQNNPMQWELDDLFNSYNVMTW